MTIKTHLVGDVSVVKTRGNITLRDGAAALRDEVRILLNGGHKKILLNLGEVSYVDSSGIGELVSAHTTTTNQGGVLKFLRINGQPLDQLAQANLLSANGFEFYDDEQEALASFK